MPANVGGILPDLSIVASAEDTTYYNEKTNYVQAGGLLRFTEDSVAFVEGVYEITVDAGKHVYTKVSGTDVYTLKEGKAYVLRTTAFVEGTAGTIEYADKNLDGEDLPAGVYEYKIQKVTNTATALVVDTKKDTVTVNTTDFAEGIKVMQNGKEITLHADTVVNAMGRRAHACEDLQNAAKELGVPVWSIGDCVKARQIGDSVREGWTAAMQIV